MNQALKVGIFMTICLLVLGWLVLRIEDLNLWGSAGQRVDALFDSVAGLDDKSAVRVAGVRVGRVDGIRLEGRRARVTLLLETPMTLVEGTRALVSNMGLLGDKYVELIPGPDGGRPLAAGETIAGETPISFDQAMAKLESIGDSIQNVTSSLAGGGGEGEGGIGGLIASFRQTADEIRALVVANRASLDGTVRNFERFSATLADELPRLTAQIERTLSQVETLMAENRDDLRGSMTNIRSLTEKMHTSVENLNEISGRIARGEGTIGKLVNSEEAHNELVTALQSVEKGVDTLTDTLGRIQKLELELGLEGLAYTDLDDSRAAFRLDLLPHGRESDRFYRVELVSDPRGRVVEKETYYTIERPDGSLETVTLNRVSIDRSKRLFSALLGLPFANQRGRLWAGLIESRAGAQVDYGLVEQRLWLSLEAFDFNRELDRDPHLRASLRWDVTPNVYLRGGYDDFLVRDYESFFVGAGVRWTDRDLKYLLGSVPKF